MRWSFAEVGGSGKNLTQCRFARSPLETMFNIVFDSVHVRVISSIFPLNGSFAV